LTRVLIVERNRALADRIAAVLTREQVSIVASAKEAAEAIVQGRIDVGIGRSAVFHDEPSLRSLRVIPWIVLTESADDELEVHHNWPEINAQFLTQDPAERYLELLPLRVRAVKSRERVIATIAAQFPGMVAYWDTNERCLFANAAYERWFGVSPQELLGKSLRELLGPIYPLNEPYIQGALRGEPKRFERTIPLPNGGPRQRALASYIPDIDNGTVRGFVAIITDISEQYVLQQALHERERRWATLFEILPVGVTVVNDQGRIVEQNQAILSILGIDDNELEQGRHKNRAYNHPDGQPIASSQYPNT